MDFNKAKKIDCPKCFRKCDLIESSISRWPHDFCRLTKPDGAFTPHGYESTYVKRKYVCNFCWTQWTEEVNITKDEDKFIRWARKYKDKNCDEFNLFIEEEKRFIFFLRNTNLSADDILLRISICKNERHRKIMKWLLKRKL